MREPYTLKELAIVYTLINVGRLMPMIAGRLTMAGLTDTTNWKEELLAWGVSAAASFIPVGTKPYYPLSTFTAGVGSRAGRIIVDNLKTRRTDRERCEHMDVLRSQLKEGDQERRKRARNYYER